jgi:hypothetical protein
MSLPDGPFNARDLPSVLDKVRTPVTIDVPDVVRGDVVGAWNHSWGVHVLFADDSTFSLDYCLSVELVGPVKVIGAEVWADGFGRWHASVPLVGNPRREAAHARRLIRAALVERGPAGCNPTFRITREHVTNHGTVHYVER